MNARRIRWSRFAALSLAGLAVVYWLARSIEWNDLREPLSRLSLSELAFGFAAYLLFVGLKARRFAAFLDVPSNLALYGVVAAQTFWSNVLPMRAGDLSYVALLRTRADEPIERGVVSLFLASLVDLFLMLALAVGLGAVFRARGLSSSGVVAISTLAAVGAVAMIGLLLASRLISDQRAQRLANSAARAPIIGRFLGKLAVELRRQSWDRALLRGSLYSTQALLMRYAFQLYLLGAMFPELSATQGLFALTFAGLVNLLPIQGVANVGSIELPWSWAMMTVGASEGVAVASGFALHGVVLLFACGVGMISLPLLRRNRREATT